MLLLISGVWYNTQVIAYITEEIIQVFTIRDTMSINH